MLHTLRAHLQVLLWKAADKDQPQAITQDITKFGWEVTENGIMPAIVHQPSAPPRLLDIISCSCAAEGRACSNRCKCHNAGLSCTENCKCEGGNTCMNPHTTHEQDEEEEEEDDEGDENDQ